MAPTPTSTYELQRQRMIEENKKRLLELGINDFMVSQQPKPRKPVIRRVQLVIEKRRSSRLANFPKVSYKEGVEDVNHPHSTPKRTVTQMGFLRRGHEPEEPYNEVGKDNPTFVKEMLKSHTSGGFWLGLPAAFCEANFKNDDRITLQDEDGREWECKYLHNKRGLSGGWRGFSLDHHLRDGDNVVFELVDHSRFKIRIQRARGSPENTHDGPVETVKQENDRKRDEDTGHSTSVWQKHTLASKATAANKRGTQANQVESGRPVEVDRRVHIKRILRSEKVATTCEVVSRTTVLEPLTRAQKEQLQSYPPGARPKAVAVCSFATSSCRKKIPSMFPAQKNNFVRHAGGKAVKVG